ncbi:MAG: bile acid:sodium symporter family protein [Sedimentisphaerales bacterium]|nr:bile acid:sodium symporter family protein [Sedimentisphaerales bacterium]
MFNKILSFYTKYFALWVVIFGGLAWWYPQPFIRLKPGMDWFFALTMFGIGAVLSVDDFKNIGRKPLIVVLGCVTQYTVMPLGAFLLARAFNLPAELAVGLVLTASAPGAMASNVICYIARADTAYSVSLTTVSTLLCPLLTPGLTLLLAGSYLDIAFWPMFWNVIKIVIVPLFIGLMIRHTWGKQMENVAKIFPAISVTFIIFICSMVIALNHEHMAELTIFILVVVLLLNLYGMGMGYTVGSIFRLDWRRRRTLCIEIGMQNAGLGTVLALKHIGPRAAIPAACFVFVCIITAAILVELWQRNGKEAEVK